RRVDYGAGMKVMGGSRDVKQFALVNFVRRNLLEYSNSGVVRCAPECKIQVIARNAGGGGIDGDMNSTAVQHQGRLCEKGTVAKTVTLGVANQPSQERQRLC